MEAQGWQRRQKGEMFRLNKGGKAWGEIIWIYNVISPIYNQCSRAKTSINIFWGISSAQTVTFLSQMIKLYSKAHKEQNESFNKSIGLVHHVYPWLIFLATYLNLYL